MHLHHRGRTSETKRLRVALSQIFERNSDMAFFCAHYPRNIKTEAMLQVVCDEVRGRYRWSLGEERIEGDESGIETCAS